MESFEVSALDLLRLQKMESGPRGLVLVVGCLGILLGLADDLPEWEGCQRVLLAQPVKCVRPPRRGSSGAGALTDKSPNLQCSQLDKYAWPVCQPQGLQLDVRPNILAYIRDAGGSGCTALTLPQLERRR